MNPSALEDLWTVVRLAAEGSDWKRDSGESLTAWAQRTLKRRSEADQRDAVLEEAAQAVASRATAIHGWDKDDYSGAVRALKCQSETKVSK